MAAGAQTNYFGNERWARYAPGLKTLADGFKLRYQLLFAFERAERAETESERSAYLNFVVIGGGATGVEMAGAMSEIAQRTLPHEFRHIDSRQTRVMLIEGGDRVLASFPPELSEKAQDQLARLKVDLRCSCRVVHIDENGVTFTSTSDGVSKTHHVAARTVVWAAGVRASRLGDQIAAGAGIPLSAGGRVPVNPDLTLEGNSCVFVVGDMAAASSLAKSGATKAVPGVSPAAKQMGRCAAKNLLNQLRQRPQRPFRYTDYGSLATIGRRAAVVDLDLPLLGPVQFSGFIAWVFWLLVHVYFLIGFRNRFMVMLDWAVSYWTFERHARVVAEPQADSRSSPGDA